MPVEGRREDRAAAEAHAVAFTADRDQSSLVRFASREDTGTGSYTLSLSCEGTDFQWQRAQFDKPCAPGQLFVQGAKIERRAAAAARASHASSRRFRGASP